jgi:hypothetical protein
MCDVIVGACATEEASIAPLVAEPGFSRDILSRRSEGHAVDCRNGIEAFFIRRMDLKVMLIKTW